MHHDSLEKHIGKANASFIQIDLFEEYFILVTIKHKHMSEDGIKYDIQVLDIVSWGCLKVNASALKHLTMDEMFLMSNVLTPKLAGIRRNHVGYFLYPWWTGEMTEDILIPSD